MKQTTTQLSDFPMPESIDIERQVLVDIVYSPEIIPEVIPLVERTMFTTENRARIWEMIVWMYNNGQQIDLLTVRSRCGQAFIVECVNPGLSPATYNSVLSHIKALRDVSARRRAYLSAIKLLEKSIDMASDEASIIEAAENASREICASSSLVSEKPLSTILKDISSDIAANKKMAEQGKSFRITSGIPSIDWLTYKGWNPGQLIVLAARPSVGKTSLMLKFAKAGAAAGFPSIIYSLEMTAEELGQKLLFSTGGITPGQVASGSVSAEAFACAAGILANLPISVNTESVNLDDIVSRIMIDAKSGRCKIVYIDYLSLMRTAGDEKVSANQSISIITRTLKVTAKRAGIPIILLVQLNRNQAKEKRPPELYDLRDSGSIEQDSDIVLMLEQTSYNAENENGASSPDINIWVRKNRQYIKDVCVTVRPNSTYSEFYDITNLGAGK